jgi:hypothetical protein
MLWGEVAFSLTFTFRLGKGLGVRSRSSSVSLKLFAVLLPAFPAVLFSCRAWERRRCVSGTCFFAVRAHCPLSCYAD